MITIIDYGAGNIASVALAFRYVGQKVTVTSDPDEVAEARRLVLPGVGNFRSMTVLEDRGLRQAISAAIASGAGFLGICLGMQWLFEGSEEAPGVHGLAAFAGVCRPFPPGTKSPHVGWNSLRMVADSRLLRGARTEEFVYFTHSFRAMDGPATVALSEHGGPFAAAVERDNTFGVQFHPEKSAAVGLAMLRNFAELSC